MHLPDTMQADETEVVLAKRTLRSHIRAARARMPKVQREAEAERLNSDLLGMDGLTVAGYLATPTEPDPGGLLARAAEVLLPIPLEAGGLGWAIGDGSRMAHERLPVSMPAGPMIGQGARALLCRSVSILLVPALAVGRDGWRLGQGGGYYDRLLAELAILQQDRCDDQHPSGPLVVAVVYGNELLDRGVVPHGAHDIPVPLALTPTGLVELG